LEFKYQSLKNLCERLLKGRKGTTQSAIQSLDRYLVEVAQEVLDEACKEADMANRKRLKGVHIERAIAILNKGR